jgi:hypothetical protein
MGAGAPPQAPGRLSPRPGVILRTWKIKEPLTPASRPEPPTIALTAAPEDGISPVKEGEGIFGGTGQPWPPAGLGEPCR